MSVDAWDLVVGDMRARQAHGQRHYGMVLDPLSPRLAGRNWLWEAYEEALDKAVYLRCQILVQQEAALAELARLGQEVDTDSGVRGTDKPATAGDDDDGN